MKRDTFWCWHASGFYFRVRGYGLAVDFNSRVTFSERNGYRSKLVRIGKFAIEVLKP